MNATTAPAFQVTDSQLETLVDTFPVTDLALAMTSLSGKLYMQGFYHDPKADPREAHAVLEVEVHDAGGITLTLWDEDSSEEYVATSFADALDAIKRLQKSANDR